MRCTDQASRTNARLAWSVHQTRFANCDMKVTGLYVNNGIRALISGGSPVFGDSSSFRKAVIFGGSSSFPGFSHFCGLPPLLQWRKDLRSLESRVRIRTLPGTSRPLRGRRWLGGRCSDRFNTTILKNSRLYTELPSKA